MRLVIVRHGNTFAPGERPRRIGAATDLALVDSGRAQAEALRLHFIALGWHFDRILSSPLQRTRETAALIAPGRAIEDADWLREIDHGPDEDRTEPEVLARIGPDALAAWERGAIAPPGWQVDAETRLAAWRELFGQERDETWLLITSNGAARFALLALGEPPVKIRTGAYGVIASVPWRVGLWNRRPEEARV